MATASNCPVCSATVPLPTTLPAEVRCSQCGATLTASSNAEGAPPNLDVRQLGDTAEIREGETAPALRSAQSALSALVLSSIAGGLLVAATAVLLYVLESSRSVMGSVLAGLLAAVLSLGVLFVALQLQRHDRPDSPGPLRSIGAVAAASTLMIAGYLLGIPAHHLLHVLEWDSLQLVSLSALSLIGLSGVAAGWALASFEPRKPRIHAILLGLAFAALVLSWLWDAEAIMWPAVVIAASFPVLLCIGCWIHEERVCVRA